MSYGQRKSKHLQHHQDYVKEMGPWINAGIDAQRALQHGRPSSIGDGRGWKHYWPVGRLRRLAKKMGQTLSSLLKQYEESLRTMRDATNEVRVSQVHRFISLSC